MGKTSQMFLSVSEVQGLLGMSKSYCYELVAKLNDELEKMDKIVIPAKYRHNFSLRNFTVWRLQMKCWKQCILLPAEEEQIKGKEN